MLVEVTVNGRTYRVAAASTVEAILNVLEPVVGQPNPEFSQNSPVSIVARKIGPKLHSIAKDDKE